MNLKYENTHTKNKYKILWLKIIIYLGYGLIEGLMKSETLQKSNKDFCHKYKTCHIFNIKGISLLIGLAEINARYTVCFACFSSWPFETIRRFSSSASISIPLTDYPSEIFLSKRYILIWPVERNTSDLPATRDIWRLIL